MLRGYTSFVLLGAVRHVGDLGYHNEALEPVHQVRTAMTRMAGKDSRFHFLSRVFIELCALNFQQRVFKPEVYQKPGCSEAKAANRQPLIDR
jgi:hypothetical protein